MALPQPLRTLDRQLRDENADRVERLRRGTAVMEPSPAAAPAARRLEPPPAYMWSTDGPYRVTYRYAGDSPFMTYTHAADSPADLVRFMRDFFRGKEHLVVVRLFERVAA